MVILQYKINGQGAVIERKGGLLREFLYLYPKTYWLTILLIYLAHDFVGQGFGKG